MTDLSNIFAIESTSKSKHFSKHVPHQPKLWFSELTLAAKQRAAKPIDRAEKRCQILDNFFFLRLHLRMESSVILKCFGTKKGSFVLRLVMNKTTGINMLGKSVHDLTMKAFAFEHDIG